MSNTLQHPRERSFPPEITDHIIDHLHDDKQTLSSCCLVNHTWYPAARYHLFSSVCVSITKPTSLLKFHDTLHSNPELRPYIRSLEVKGGEQQYISSSQFVFQLSEIHDIVEILPNLQDLSLRYISLRSQDISLDKGGNHPPPLPRQLRSLTLSGLAIGNRTLRILLGTFPISNSFTFTLNRTLNSISATSLSKQSIDLPLKMGRYSSFTTDLDMPLDGRPEMCTFVPSQSQLTTLNVILQTEQTQLRRLNRFLNHRGSHLACLQLDFHALKLTTRDFYAVLADVPNQISVSSCPMLLDLRITFNVTSIPHWAFVIGIFATSLNSVQQITLGMHSSSNAHPAPGTHIPWDEFDVTLRELPRLKKVKVITLDLGGHHLSTGLSGSARPLSDEWIKVFRENMPHSRTKGLFDF